MKEKLIEFTTAKLAKEKGFNQRWSHYYTWNDEKHILCGDFGVCDSSYGIPSTEHSDIPVAYAPTQSLLQKWLREEHELIVETRFAGEDRFYADVYNRNYGLVSASMASDVKNFEQALEAGIKSALQLIK
jgi:hypothetical protein